DTLIKNNHSTLKTYIEDMVTKITNSLNKVDSENKSIDKAIAFDSILNSYYIIRSQKDQIRTEIVNSRDNYYLTDSKVKSELDGTISGLDTEFDSITKLINSVNKETVSHTEISNIQKELIEYVHKFSDIIKIISEAGRLISEELRRIQETYTENVRDEILSHLGDILGLEYDPIRKELIGDLSAMLEIIALKEQILELINRMNNWESALDKLENNMVDSNDRLSALGEKLDRNILDLGDMNASLSMQMGKIIDGITSTTGLTYDPETGQLMGDLSIKSDLEYVQDRLSKTRTELENVKTDLSRTKVNLEEQRDMLNDTEVYIQESKEELELT